VLKKASRNSRVVDVKNDPYIPVLKTLLNAVNEQNVRLENLRILLVKRGVFSDADFQAELAETQKQWSQAFSEMIARAVDDANVLMRQQLLDSHKGEPQ
jgi:hypothetical protein